MEKVSSRESISEENKSRNSWRLETSAALGQRCGARRAKTMSFFRGAFPGPRHAEERQGVAIRKGELLDASGFPRGHHDVEHLFLGRDKEKVVALRQLGTQEVALPRLQLEQRGHPREIVDLRGPDDGGVDREA